MPTEAKEHEERSHSPRTLILLFLVCVAVCAIFFSMGFIVGYNERGSRMAPATEVVNAPAAIPPTINPPPDSTPAPSSPATPGSASPGTTPETEVLPPAGTSSAPPPAKPAETAPGAAPSPATAPSKPNPSSPPAPAAGAVGEGITLQVAALRTRQDAEALVDVLKTRGYPVFMVTPEYAHSDDNLFRVQVGPFRTAADAGKVRDKLVQEGFKPFIKH